MENNRIKRRDFIRRCLTSTAAFGALSFKNLFSGEKEAVYDAKGLPTRILGKTGVRVPLIAIGGGSRFCTIEDPEKSIEMLNYALDHGFYYWDTAHDYAYDEVVSEERYGSVLKERREEVFLSTKVGDRTYDGAMRHLEESLKRLQTDHLDLYQIHSIESLEDVEKIGAKDGVLKAINKLREEKVTRFIGYSGHLSAEAMTAMASHYDFDTMLIALNHYAERKGDLEKEAIPAAAKKKMGILAMKVIRPRETVENISPEDLIRYALSLPDVHCAVIGTDSLEVVNKNLALLRNYEKMSPNEMGRIQVKLEPFFEGRSLTWMQPGYTDGHPA